MINSENCAAILLSRQPLRPCRLTPWVQAATRAVRWLKGTKAVLYTSVGIQTYEFLLYLALKEKIRQKVVLPVAADASFNRLRKQVQEQFQTDDQLVTFIFATERRDRVHDKLPVVRDRYIISHAGTLLPIAVREGGNMDKLITQREAAGVCVNRQFQTVYQKRQTPIAYHLDEKTLLSEITKFDEPYLIHWTRAANGPWLAEKRIDYYRAIAQADVYPRSAFDTLKNILKQKLICGSSKHKTGKIASVSFSSLAPRDMLPLMRWRSRYRQMYFEPYGIGVKKEDGLHCGIRPVHYYQGKTAPADIEPWLIQSVGRKGDWFKEQEYRFQGDFDMSGLPLDKMICFCHTVSEAANIQKKFKIKAIGFYDTV
ncbi:hypothetical protein QUF75_08495 [Desulfococcaceae bacterium HSG7]|nr:hypothetical protein [Desulfococcaceae bacterium HSG7]